MISKSIKLVADQAFTSTTPADVVGMVFPVKSGLYYEFEFWIVARTTSNTVGLVLTVTMPSFTKMGCLASIMNGPDGTAGVYDGAITSSGDQVVSNQAPLANIDYMNIVRGIIVPSANGLVQLQAARETNAGGATVTVRQGTAGFITSLAA